MIEEQIKILCKWAVDNGHRPFTFAEKEALKVAIDQAQDVFELLTIALSTMHIN